MIVMIPAHEMARLREKLLREREGLGKLVEEVESEISGLEGPLPIERLEQAQLEENRAVLTGLDEQERAALREITRALGRMESGSYGLCEACGRPISLARLHANPRVAVCLQCQMIREKLGSLKEKRQERIQLALRE